jgi:hypothetical protein
MQTVELGNAERAVLVMLLKQTIAAEPFPRRACLSNARSWTRYCV